MPRPRYHAAVSVVLATLVVARSRRWQDALPILVAGVLVDADHVIDLLANRATRKPVWAILPLHAWEWVLVLMSRRTRLSDGLAGGLSVHLALDQFNSVITHPLFYWISMRGLYGFRARLPLIDPDGYARGSAWMTKSPREWF